MDLLRTSYVPALVLDEDYTNGHAYLAHSQTRHPILSSCTGSVRVPPSQLVQDLSRLCSAHLVGKVPQRRGSLASCMLFKSASSYLTLPLHTLG